MDIANIFAARHVPVELLFSLLFNPAQAGLFSENDVCHLFEGAALLMNSNALHPQEQFASLQSMVSPILGKIQELLQVSPDLEVFLNFAICCRRLRLSMWVPG